MRVVVSAVSFSFGDREVLTDFSCEFPAATVTALVGPSGSGKSTLLNAISGFVAPRSGRISVHPADGPELAPSSELVAWVPQGVNCLGARSALDNVMLAPLSEGRRLADAADAAEAALVRVGLADRLHTAVRRLSGGELQRVSLARALASAKPIILADEPTSSLDARNTEVMAGLLHGLSVDATVIVATHDPLMIEAVGNAVDVRGPSRAA